MSDEYVPAGVILQLGTVIMPQRLNSALKLELQLGTYIALINI